MDPQDVVISLDEVNAKKFGSTSVISWGNCNWAGFALAGHEKQKQQANKLNPPFWVGTTEKMDQEARKVHNRYFLV